MTIENDKQLAITQRQLARLIKNRNRHIKSNYQDPNLSIIHKAQLEGMESIIKDLEKEIEDYTK